MRPLFHPSIEDITVESILHALSDPVRAAIYADIVASNCAQTCSTFRMVSEKPIPKSTLSQHFKALREAGLIRSERRGVEMHNTSRCAELEPRFPGLIPAILTAHTAQSTRKPRPPTAAKRKSART
jgi:DNA-binding transcriptional ArsR family regulator